MAMRCSLFTPQEFCVLAEVVGETRRRIQAESEPDIEVWELPKPLVM
jgi:hypothetical protein